MASLFSSFKSIWLSKLTLNKGLTFKSSFFVEALTQKGLNLLEQMPKRTNVV
jgi:hypothetical protein